MMTRPSLFWADTAQLTKLAGQVRSATMALDSASVAVKNSQSRRSPALEPAISAQPTPAEALSEIPTGSFDERLSSMMSRIHATYEVEFGFVVDQEGLALVHESAPLELIAATAAMSELWDELRQRFDLANRNLQSLSLTEGRAAHILTSQTPWGRLSLGLVVDGSMTQTDLRSIHRFFRQTVE